MSNTSQFLVLKDQGKLQLPYAEYLQLMERKKEAERILQTRDQVMEALKSFLARNKSVTGSVQNVATPATVRAEERVVTERAPEPVVAEKVRMEFSAEDSDGERTSGGRSIGRGAIPAVKKEIAEHFNLLDESGRVFNVFMQYYTCLNEACGGIVRVTMKDGVCSLWNYDAWEEFGFVDVMESGLRFSLDLRYENELSNLDYCDVPRLLSLRRKVTSVRVTDLNKTMLGVLTRAFHEVGLTMS